MRLSVNSIHCASSDAIEGKADIGRSSGLLWRDAIDPLGHSVRVFVAMHRTDPLQTCYSNFAIRSLGQARLRRREFIRLIGATAGPFEGVDERVIAARNLDRGAGGASGGEGGGVSWRRMRPRLDSRGGRSRIGMTVAGRAIGLLRCALIAAAIAPLPAAAEPLLMDVARAELGYDRRTGEPLVAFVLTQPSARAFAQLTAANIGRRIAIGVGGKVFERPVVREPILVGMGQISGMASVEEARDIAARLSSGAAKLELEALAD